MLVNYYALFTLSEEDEHANGSPVGIMNWLRLSRGIRLIISQMMKMSSEMLQGTFLRYNVPDL